MWLFLGIICYSFTDFKRVAAGQLEPVFSSCYDGSYRVSLPPFGPCSGFRPCEPGFHCNNGVKSPCPAGFYGDRPGLNSSMCSGQCAAGYFCLEGTVHYSSRPCGNSSVYCPTGSAKPLPVPPGYYSIDINGEDVVTSISLRSSIAICPVGYYCQQGVKSACPGGRFGVTLGLISPNCSGICPGGFSCPPASIRPYDHPCPLDRVGVLRERG
ncbi:hypothetical protein EON65_39170, partial [archaeon]